MRFRQKTSLLILLAILFLNSCSNPTVPTQSPNVTAVRGSATNGANLPLTVEPHEQQPQSEQLDQAFQGFLDNMENYNGIGIKALYTMLSQNPPPFLLDVRDLMEIEEVGYIEGAVHIPLRELASPDKIALLPAFDTPVVIYCNSGWRSSIAMTLLGALGWGEVFSLKDGGVIGWAQSGYPVVKGKPEGASQNAAQPAARLLERFNDVLSSLPEDKGAILPEAFLEEIKGDPSTVVIDVRRSEELQATGYIKNSIHLPLEDFITLQAEWPKQKDAKILVYCSSGHRSTIAMTILWTYGYTNVRSLIGGIGV